MTSSDRTAELEALETLRLLSEHLDISKLSAEDRDALSRWAAAEGSEGLEPKVFPFAGATLAAMVYDPSDEGLEPRLVPIALALRAFDAAIRQGLPGAEHLVEEFLHHCGFDEASARQMLMRMVSRAPPPDPEALN